LLSRTTELAGVLFEHDADEVEACLAAMVEAIREHYAVLTDGWERQCDERDRIADAAKAARGAPLRVVAPEGEDDERQP
jgi:hypothetical protein